jgi:hypothetical protein
MQRNKTYFWMVKVKVLPFPSSDFREMLPPSFETRLFTVASPIPVPSFPFRSFMPVVLKRLKISSCTPKSIPIPLSAIEKLWKSGSSQYFMDIKRCSFKLYFRLLSIRFRKICVRAALFTFFRTPFLGYSKQF